MKILGFTFLLLFVVNLAVAQIDEIKRKSTENSNRSDRGSGSSGSSGGGNAFVFFDMFRLLTMAQAAKLEKKDSVKRMVSFETFLQGAVQPSNYYLMNPRVRGNWGLFATDFRYNYLIEDGHGNGTHDLSTLDWQILVLNVVTTKNVIGRVGFGNMYEKFGGKQSFFECTSSLTINSNNQMISGNIEYRVAKDYNTNAVPRREINFFIDKQVFTSGSLHAYITLGGVYQRYYQSVSVWGMQGGLVFRFF